MSEIDPAIEALPGSDLVERGLADLARGAATPEAALIEVARTRLCALGVLRPSTPTSLGDPQLRLYERLAARHPERDPYVLYCAWLDQLASFLSALGPRREREGRTTATG